MDKWVQAALKSTRRGNLPKPPHKPGASTVARSKVNDERAITRQAAVEDAAARWLAAGDDIDSLAPAPQGFRVELARLKTTMGRKRG